MGTLYLGPYHEEIDAYSHEAYEVRVMPDDVETSTSGGKYGRDGHVGYRAHCECGWLGATVYPAPTPDPGECEEAINEWQRDHIDPMVEQARQSAWPDWVRRAATQADTASKHIAAGRHHEAVEVIKAIQDDLLARLRTATDLLHRSEGGQ